MNPEDVTIIVDTREQKPLEFERSEVSGLKTGDYSIKGYEDSVTFEHKTIKDLIGTCSYKNRDRFRRELQRMKDSFDFYCIVISGSQDDVETVCRDIYKTQMRQYAAKKRNGYKGRAPMRPECRIPSVLGSLKAFRVDYNCHYYFMGDKENAAAWIQEQAEYYVRHEET